MFFTIWDPFVPIWTLLDLSNKKLFFDQIDFCLKWSKSVQMGPKESQIVQKNLGLPFWTLLDPFGLISLHFDHFSASPPQSSSFPPPPLHPHIRYIHTISISSGQFWQFCGQFRHFLVPYMSQGAKGGTFFTP